MQVSTKIAIGVEKSIIEWSCLFLSAIYVTLAINYILVGDLEFQVTVVENPLKQQDS